MSDETEMDSLVSDITGKTIEPQPSAEPVSREATPPAAPAEPARDEHGRFAAKPVAEAPPSETLPAAAPQAAPAEAPKDGMPPPYALTWKAERNAEREKRQALERELAEFRAQQQQPEAEIPSPLEDPQGYAAYHSQMIAAAQWNARAETSELIARSALGDDLVQKAMDWSIEKSTEEKNRLGYSPFALQQLQQRHPIDWVVKQMKREELVSQIGDDDTEYVRRRAAELGLIANTSPQPAANGMAVPTQPTAPRQPSPQRSLAAAPTAGSHTGSVPIGLEATMDAVFPSG